MYKYQLGCLTALKSRGINIIALKQCISLLITDQQLDLSFIKPHKTFYFILFIYYQTHSSVMYYVK